MKLTQFEATANSNLQQNQTSLAYRDLNVDFFNLEKSTLKGKELKDWERQHEEKKKNIEAAWRTQTRAEVIELRKRGATRSKKDQEYYRPFSLKELEVFIKNSDYKTDKGNSDSYNNVATELELYNRIMEKGNPLEAYGILKNIVANANSYIRDKHPHSTKGKIRKAIISEIKTKANAQIETQREAYKNKADQMYKEVQDKDVTDEKVNEAFKAQYDLIYQVLNGNIELSKEELSKLDDNVSEIFEKVLKQKVYDGQAANISTKFFNALGWSGNEPRIVRYHELEEGRKEMQRSPLKKKMYHSMNPVGDMKDAKEFARQLAGVGKDNNHLFYGLGRFGKGIYTSARADIPGATDNKAEENSWSYGKKVGAVMVIMTLNEHARMFNHREFGDKEQELVKKFSKFNQMLTQEQMSKSGYQDHMTMQAALYGYNTLIDYATGISGVDYYVTTDRKALTISNEIRIREDECSTDHYDYDDLKDMD